VRVRGAGDGDGAGPGAEGGSEGPVRQRVHRDAARGAVCGGPEPELPRHGPGPARGGDFPGDAGGDGRAGRGAAGPAGGGDRGAEYLGIIYLIGAALTCFAAASQITATRTEEADGHADHLLARPVSRWRWLAGQIAVAATLIIIASLAAGLAGWAALAGQHTALGFTQLAKAGINIAPPALFVLGAGCLAYGAWPRLAPAVAYGLVAWSFLIELLATVITNRWLLDTSVLRHIQPVPAAQPDWTTAAWPTGLGILAALTGTALFSHRDLAGT
jgi:polyether ionophore transport system permease protein